MRPSLDMFRGARVLAVALGLGSVYGCASTPAYLSMEGDQLWAEGVAAFEDEDYDDAVEMLDRLVTQYPGHPQSADARIRIARAYRAQEQYISAAAEYERFLQIYFSHPYAAEASLGICESYAAMAPNPQRDQSYTETAHDACLRTVLEFQGLQVAQTAESIRIEMIERLAESVFQEATWYDSRELFDQARIVYEDVVEQFPETSWAPKALQGIYESYVEVGWDEEAQEIAVRIAVEYPDSPEADALIESGVLDVGSGGSGLMP